MEETGLIYFLIPIGYGILLLSLLVLAIIVHFFRKTRFLGSYFLVTAVTSVPGFVAGFFVCALFFRWQKTLWNDPKFTSNLLVQIAIVQAPFAISLGFVVMGLAAGAYMVRRSRRQRRFTTPVRP